MNSQKKSLEIEQHNSKDRIRLIEEPLSAFFETLRFELVTQAMTVGHSPSVILEQLVQKSKVENYPFGGTVRRDMENKDGAEAS